MGYHDHYLFMDGCIVKGCKPYVDFRNTFGEYASALMELYEHGAWGRGERRILGLRVPSNEDFDDWADTHVHTAQSTQNLRTGASRVDAYLQSIVGTANIHLFGSSAAGSAILEYFLLSDPETLYFHASDPRGRRIPAGRYHIDPRIASLLTIDAPADWVPLRRSRGVLLGDNDPGTLGHYLAQHTRLKAGPGCSPDAQTARMEDVPGTWVGSRPVAGIAYDNTPHYAYLPEIGLERHIYTGAHASRESRAFAQRAWR